MKINYYQKIILFLFYCLALTFLLNNSLSYLDTDLGWHLKVGQDIKEQRQIPHENYYNFSLENMTWVDHEWFSDLVLYQIYQKAGYTTLTFFFAFIIIAVFLIQLFFIKKHFAKTGSALFLVVFLQGLGLLAMSPHLGIRLQELALLFLLILLIIIYYYTKTGKKAWLWGLPLLFYVWAISHGSFLIGLFLLFAWLFIKILENILSARGLKIFDYSQKLGRQKLTTFFGFSLLSVLATLITPYGLSLYSFLGGYKNTFYLSRISEWLSQAHFPLQYWQLLYLAIVSSFFALSVYFSFSKKNYKLRLWDSFLLVLFVGLSFKSRRHFPLMFVATLPLAIEFLTHFFGTTDNRPIKKTLTLKITDWLIPACLLLVMLSKLLGANFTNDPFSAYCRVFPCQAVDFLNANPELKKLRVLNDYNYGGYLIWTMPEMKLFIDGRFPQYAYGQHTFLEEYYEFFDLEKTDRKLEEHQIEMIFLRSQNKPYKINRFEKIFFNLKPDSRPDGFLALHEFLQTKENWEKVYSDEVAIIYIKKTDREKSDPDPFDLQNAR